MRLIRLLDVIWLAVVLVGAPVAMVAAGSGAPDLVALEKQVADSERGFAKSMADRDLKAFQSFLAPDAVFAGDKTVSRGAAQVVEAWKRLYEGAQAPFSWEPEMVMVNDGGTLAFSSGPVRDPSGKRVGTFNSIWRRDADGSWKVIFDKGCPRCTCP